MSFRGLKLIAMLSIGASSMLFNSAATAEQSDKIGTINGQAVTQGQFITFARSTAPKANLQDPEVQKQVLQGFIGRELLYQQAVEKKLDQLPGVKMAIEEQRRAIIAQALAAQLAKANPITEENLRAFYESEIKKSRQDGKKPAAFEKVRPQLTAILQDRMLGAYVAELQKKAKMEFGK